MGRVLFFVIAFSLLSCGGKENLIVTYKDGKVVFKPRINGTLLIADFGGYPYRVEFTDIPVKKGGRYEYDVKGDFVSYVFINDKDSLIFDTSWYVLTNSPLSEYIKTIYLYRDSTEELYNKMKELRIKNPDNFAFFYSYIHALYHLGKVEKENIRDTINSLLEKHKGDSLFLTSACLISIYILKDTTFTKTLLELLREKYPKGIYYDYCYAYYHYKRKNYDSVLTVDGDFYKYPNLRIMYRFSAWMKAYNDKNPEFYKKAYLSKIPEGYNIYTDYSFLFGLYGEEDTVQMKEVIDTLEKNYGSMVEIAKIDLMEGWRNIVKEYTTRNPLERFLKKSLGYFHNEKLIYYLLSRNDEKVYKALLEAFDHDPKILDYHLHNFAGSCLSVGDTARYLKAAGYLYFYQGDSSVLHFVRDSLNITTDSLRKLVKFDTLGYFKAITLKGDTIKKEDLKGKVAVINFWATWCGPCVSEIPVLNELVERFKGDTNIVFIAISDENPKVVKRFLKKHEFKYTVCAGGKDMFRKYNVFGIPVHMIVSPKGIILLRRTGGISSVGQLENSIKRVLKSLVMRDKNTGL